jgi:response regulator of citrate/malate metabolism
MNLLIIEDDLFLANKMKQIFQKKNFINRVNLLLNFEDFLNEFYLLNTYDIILVDILL